MVKVLDIAYRHELLSRYVAISTNWPLKLLVTELHASLLDYTSYTFYLLIIKVQSGFF